MCWLTSSASLFNWFFIISGDPLLHVARIQLVDLGSNSSEFLHEDHDVVDTKSGLRVQFDLLDDSLNRARCCFFSFRGLVHNNFTVGLLNPLDFVVQRPLFTAVVQDHLKGMNLLLYFTVSKESDGVNCGFPLFIRLLQSGFTSP